MQSTQITKNNDKDCNYSTPITTTGIYYLGSVKHFRLNNEYVCKI